jgi:hypothetical protein
MDTKTDKVVKPHVLTVTGRYDLDEGIDGREFFLTCPGIEAGNCAGYTPCEVADCPSKTDLRWWEKSAHGVDHANVDGEWMVPTGQCYYLTLGADGLPDAANDLRAPGVPHGLDAGEYEVFPEYVGDGDYYLILVPTGTVIGEPEPADA